MRRRTTRTGRVRRVRWGMNSLNEQSHLHDEVEHTGVSRLFDTIDE